ncbi:MAG: hypothetical protein AB8B63_20135 [Granulosicoccus sp.]
MNRYTISAISLLIVCLAGSSVFADNKTKAVNLQRLFFTPLERAQLTPRPLGAATEEDSLSPEEGSAARQMPDSGLQGSVSRRMQTGELQSAQPASITYNALVIAAKGVHVLLNGVPCHRFDERLHGMPDQTVVRLNCPHIDNSRYKIDYLASVEKIDVYGDGKRLGLLSIGESL